MVKNPLTSITLADVLDLAFRLYRQRFGSFLRTVGLPLMFYGIVMVALSAVYLPIGVQFFPVVLGVIFALTSSLAARVLEQHLNPTPRNIHNGWKSLLWITLQTFLKIVVSVIYVQVAQLIALFVALVFSRCSFSIVGLSSGSCPPGGESPLVFIMGSATLVFAALGLIWLLSISSLAEPIALYEQRNIIYNLRESARLIRPQLRRGMLVTGIVLLMYVLVQLPLFILMTFPYIVPSFPVSIDISPYLVVPVLVFSGIMIIIPLHALLTTMLYLSSKPGFAQPSGAPFKST
jgi:hypothetical protein